jgi:hypothetical protein
MTIKIVLPEGKGAKSGRDTRFYTDEGHEINGVTGCNIEILPNGVIQARLDMIVEDVRNLEGIRASVTVVPPRSPQVDAFIKDILGGGK